MMDSEIIINEKRVDNKDEKQEVTKVKAKQKAHFRIDTFAWIALAVITVYYTDIINALMIDSRISGWFYNIALWSTAITVVVALYFIVWCSMVKGLDSDDWEKQSPYGIPVATGCGVSAGISWTIALWGVYGIQSPIIVFFLFMGFVMSVAILPPWTEKPKIAAKED